MKKGARWCTFLIKRVAKQNKISYTIDAMCGYGGIGRRAGFRFQWETVQVQVLLATPNANKRVFFKEKI